jgi:archaetidylinositol phosphate synthase
MSGALMVSYTRARAENEIEKCDVGIAERGERLIIIFLGIITDYIEVAVIIVAILAHLTAIQRIIYTRGRLRKREI